MWQHFLCKNAKKSIGPLEMRWCCSSLLQRQDVKQRVNNDENLFNSLLHFSDLLLYYSKFDVNVPEVKLINLMLSAKSLPGITVHFREVFCYYCSSGTAVFATKAVKCSIISVPYGTVVVLDLDLCCKNLYHFFFTYMNPLTTLSDWILQTCDEVVHK